MSPLSIVRPRFQETFSVLNFVKRGDGVRGEEKGIRRYNSYNWVLFCFVFPSVDPWKASHDISRIWFWECVALIRNTLFTTIVRRLENLSSDSVAFLMDFSSLLEGMQASVWFIWLGKLYWLEGERMYLVSAPNRFKGIITNKHFLPHNLLQFSVWKNA